MLESINNSYIKYLYNLQSKKYRDVEKRFLIEGVHLVEEARKTNNLEVILTSDSSYEIDGIKRILVSENIIKKLSFTKAPQNVIGVCKYIQNKGEKATRFLLLDEIQDPGNLGVLVRSALGFNIDKIYLSKNSVDKYNDKFIRATQGALFHIDIEEANLEEVIYNLKQRNILVYGTSVDSGVELTSLDLLDEYAIILGNEGKGIKQEILNITNTNIFIKTNPLLESLNVAVAGSIILHYFDQKNPKFL